MIIKTVRPLPVTPARIPFAPSEAPAAEHPEYEPTDADLDAVLLLSDIRLLTDEEVLGNDFAREDELDERLLAAAVLASCEHKLRELQLLTRSIEVHEPVIERAAESIGCVA